MTRFLPILIVFLLISCKVNKQEKQSLNIDSNTSVLFNNLKEVAKDKILFGQADVIAYGVGWRGGDEINSDIKKVSGDHPAVFGWDIGHIDSTNNIDSITFSEIRRLIIWAYENGGVNTMSWHGINPLTGGSSWDTTRVVKHILPGGKLHEAFKQKLDKVAAFLNSLESNGKKVPVIFRPYHEHNGGWFWWGNATCPNEEYKQLWRFTADYLRGEKNVKNILLCYSTDAFFSKEEYLERYPGDDYVDVFGFDDYKSIKSADTRDVLVKRFEVVNTLAREQDKLALLAETGMEKVPDSTWFTNILLEGIKAATEQGHTDRVAWALVWRNAYTWHHYAPYPGHPACDDFVKFKNDPDVLFLNDLPEMYKPIKEEN